MRVLVTAGSTKIEIDRVRLIDNIFKGKTGLRIARYFHDMGMDVKLLTSSFFYTSTLFACLRFRTFDELQDMMKEEISQGSYDIIIHSAAVSDYFVRQVLIRAGGDLHPIDVTKKISSSHERLYLELAPTTKLIDQIRLPWGFTGKLVKFKLEVDKSDKELIEIARKSMATSKADYIVANCLEWCNERAYILGANGICESVTRVELPAALYAHVGGKE